MKNKGAFIVFKGDDMLPNFTKFECIVIYINKRNIQIYHRWLMQTNFLMAFIEVLYKVYFNYKTFYNKNFNLRKITKKY